MPRIRTRHERCGEVVVVELPLDHPLDAGAALHCPRCDEVWWHFPAPGELSGAASVQPSPAPPPLEAPSPPPAPAPPPSPPRTRASPPGRGRDAVREDQPLHRPPPAPAVRPRSDRGADAHVPPELRAAPDAGWGRWALSLVALCLAVLAVYWFVSSGEPPPAR